MSIYKRTLGLVIAGLIASGAYAADEYFLNINNPECSMGYWSKAQKKFVKSQRPLSWYARRTFVGRPLATARNVMVFRMLEDDDHQLFAAGKACFKQGGIYNANAPDVTEIKINDLSDLKIDHMNDNLISRRPGYYFVGLTSWQETVTLVQKAGTTTDRLEIPVSITAMTLCPGFGKMILRTETMLFAWDSCIPFGFSEIGYKKSNDSNPKFQSSDARIYGLMTGPKLVRDFTEKISAGLYIPFTYRHVHMPSVDTDTYTAPSKNSLFPSFLIVGEYRREDWLYAYKVGMVRSWPNYLWSFQISKMF